MTQKVYCLWEEQIWYFAGLGRDGRELLGIFTTDEAAIRRYNKYIETIKRDTINHLEAYDLAYTKPLASKTLNRIRSFTWNPNPGIHGLPGADISKLRFLDEKGCEVRVYITEETLEDD